MRILAHPSPALRQNCPEVDPKTDSELAGLVEEMGRAMYDAPGIGLAAPQIGVLKRVVVYDLDEGEGLCAIVNPVIVERSEETEFDEEGCLSLPGIGVTVERSVRVVCEAVDCAGEPVRLEAEGLHARMLQHECDHLDGVLIIDRANPDDRKEALRRYRDVLEGRRPADGPDDEARSGESGQRRRR